MVLGRRALTEGGMGVRMLPPLLYCGCRRHRVTHSVPTIRALGRRPAPCIIIPWGFNLQGIHEEAARG